MKRKIIIYFLIFILGVTQFSGCNKDSGKNSPRTYTHFCFDTVCQITFYDTYTENEGDIAKACFEMCDKYDQLFNKHNNESEISQINSPSSHSVAVSKETYDIIKNSIHYSNLSNGAFDITISPIADLWDIGNHPQIPKKHKISQALKYVNFKDIVLKDNSVKLSQAGQSIDLGGIAKGYVADKLKIFLESKKISSAIINLGGNILTIGGNNKKDFKVGIKKPFGKNDTDYSATILIQDKSVVTSGIYERYFKANNTIYHHILDPKTGYPVDNNLYSVTIISDKSEEGDALSTATFVIGLEKGLSFINQLEHIEAVFITKDYKIHLSDGLTINDKKEIRISK